MALVMMMMRIEMRHLHSTAVELSDVESQLNIAQKLNTFINSLEPKTVAVSFFFRSLSEYIVVLTSSFAHDIRCCSFEVY